MERRRKDKINGDGERVTVIELYNKASKIFGTRKVPT